MLLPDGVSLQPALTHPRLSSLPDPDFVIPEEAANMYWEANSRKVYRLLTHKDIKSSIKDTDVYILWPDDGTWYMAEVEQVGQQHCLKAQPCSCSCS